ncbi:hydroxyacylglutathione hydrolase [Buchnera aphidicola (Nipponaphis monzeni)]|uniref:Hydroxyacylglutathione hydrolase n=1 Tax=Buchnera aphidicola (Nipponaphis monzeni) TaxID=2495405 RepID=A0A455TA27_9GAMM|nr:hydroxyacylglutathione hydrolase [Buchnera aphidicola]BBI01207.1 hydroxyacylglutathione hydrolase [Buchnera aphidicola (Nipponaphis monzeni)]
MVISIPILKDNYSWIIHNNKNCIIIDPGESNSILSYIKGNYIPIAILITHKHNDHTQGIKNIVINYPKIKVYSPLEFNNQFVTNIVHDSEEIYLLNRTILVINTSGHTKYHVSYYMKPYLFCGDTLFSAGCGKIYKNLYFEMYHSLKKISSFPENTFMCCGHEYTYNNLLFAINQFPMDKKIAKFLKHIKLIKKNNKHIPILSLREEKKINIFLRTHEIHMQKYKKFDYNRYYPWQFFKHLRKIKNNFKQ